MTTTRNDQEFMRRCLAFLLLLGAQLFFVHAGAQTDVSGLTDDELMEQIHRETYRAEFDRRMGNYTVEERQGTLETLFENRDRRRFPQDYTIEELFEYIREPSDRKSYLEAQVEMEQRYRNVSDEEVIALAARLRAAFEETPYPVRGTVGYESNLRKYNALAITAGKCLSEGVALNLLREVYLDSGQKGSITQFLLKIEGKPFTGPATRALLAELEAQMAGLGDRELTARHENDYLQGILGNRIRQCADNSFEAIKARDWQKSDLDIHAMGHFEASEARELLLGYYDTLSKDFLHLEKRRRVLEALTTRWDREHDFELRKLLRDELTDMLRRDYSQSLTLLVDLTEVIGKTGDPYFIPLLKRYRADLDLTEIRRTTALPAEYLEANIESTLKTFGQTIATLEAQQ